MQDRILVIILRIFVRLLGLFLVGFSLIYLISLLSFDPKDISFNSFSTKQHASNWMGSFGSHLSDLSLQFIGFSSFFLSLIIFSIGTKMVSKDGVKNILLKVILTPACILCFSAFFSSLSQPSWWEFASLGGMNGSYVLAKFDYFPTFISAVIFLILAVVTISMIIEISLFDWIYFLRYTFLSAKFLCNSIMSSLKDENSSGFVMKKRNVESETKQLDLLENEEEEEEESDEEDEEYEDEEEEEEEEYEDDEEDEYDEEDEDDEEEYEEEEEEYEEDEEDDDEEEEESAAELKKRLKKVKSSKSKKKKKAYQLPPIDLLVDRSDENKNKKIPKKAIKEQSELLLKVLEDFGVKGESLGAKVGPVITLHEFEPVAGTKASRVIGLSEDIARSMSAVSARIAVISGKTSIGVEIPNLKREMIFLRELMESKEYRFSQNFLPVILGKNIGGDIMVADLAKMPHLLIAGTTGSGKSVGLNVMILSLLFKLRPDECKFIMIDPKMLELSIYDGIPHLLSPVVTEPQKAVVALKWVVAEMEERYRLMSSFAVRNIAGYNEKAEKAIINGDKLTKKVQTGYDPTNGQPIIEEIEFEPKKLPFIVVIVDEMADLMLVAGKEIEGLIQRLAQMARAAGIHIIMATQRPSVDVITGVIKANFPTRISFQVTSRIDSRTILGAQGAEQLLGRGDMIYMAGGSKTTRVHGPFCSDLEIENIVNFIKEQDAEEFSEEEQISFDSLAVEQAASHGGPELGEGGAGDIYQQAIMIVRRDNKASISYIQRQLRIGYNKAATLVERMEQEGIISAPGPGGKREVLEEK